MRRVLVGTRIPRDRGGDDIGAVRGDAMGLSGGQQRAAGRHLAGEQVLEQVAALRSASATMYCWYST